MKRTHVRRRDPRSGGFVARFRFTLTDAEAMNAAHPDTFWLAQLADRVTLDVGDHVRLGFETVGGDERMWVNVVERTHVGYVGALLNWPAFARLNHGDLVAFEARHVLKFHREVTDEPRPS